MKKVIILLVIISIAAFGQQHSESLEGKVILMLKNNTSLSDSVKVEVKNQTGNYKIDEINRLHQSKSVTKKQLGRKTNKFIYIIQFPPGTNLKPIIDAYYETGEIEYAEPDYIGTIGGAQEVVPNDQYYFRQWGLHNDGTFPPGVAVAGCDLDMQNAWEIEQGDSSIVVGILDTGVKFDHPELAGRTWINYDEIPGNLIDDDANGYIDDVKGWNFAGSNNNPVDGHGHGTNITGIIGANSNNAIGYSGADWNCKLMILKGFTDGGGGNVSWWANAIYYAVDNGARVINMSFGITNNSITLEDAVNYALENNVVLVACMMNDNSNTVYYPAAYTGVIAVGSTDWDDTRSEPFPWNPNSGSNWGDHISVVAPGNVIFGLDYISNTNYEVFFSGTSQATANVSGVASLLLAQDPERTPCEIRYILEATAEDMVGDPLEDTPGWDQYYGFGRVNAYYALLSSQPCLPEGITFTTQEEIDNFQTNYPGCTEIEGDVFIGNNSLVTDINHLDSLNVLTSIWGSLTITNNPIASLSGLENLDYIGGSFSIGSYGWGCLGNDNLVNLTGLNGLDSIGGDLDIPCNQALANLTGLESLTKIGGTFSVGKNVYMWGGNPSLVNLTGLTSLTDVQNIFIRQNLALTSLTGLEGLASIEGILVIRDNPITSLSGLSNLSFVGGTLLLRNTLVENLSELENLEFIGDLRVYENEQLQSLAGLENIEFIGGSLGIADNDQLVDLSGLENIDSIGGWLSIGTIYGVGDPPPPGGNDLLTDLSALLNLNYVGEGIDIGQNNSLISLAGLENITAATITDLLIGYNSSLSTCEVKSVCDYLASPNGQIIIEWNAPGCNSQEEVEEACFNSVEENKTGNGIIITPNPATDKITISSPAISSNTLLSIFNVSGEKVMEMPLTDTETQIKMGALPRGVYFVRLQNEKMVEVRKMVKE